MLKLYFIHTHNFNYIIFSTYETPMQFTQKITTNNSPQMKSIKEMSKQMSIGMIFFNIIWYFSIQNRQQMKVLFFI